MNKHTIIVAISAIAITLTVGHSILNSVFAEELVFRWAGLEDFSLFSLVYGGRFDVCNTAAIPVSFKQYSIKLVHQNEELGTFVAKGTQVPSHSITSITGKFDSPSQTIAGVTSLLLDTELKGTDVLRLDARQSFIMTQVQTDILGFIPYSISKQYSSSTFFELMNDDNLFEECIPAS